MGRGQSAQFMVMTSHLPCPSHVSMHATPFGVGPVQSKSKRGAFLPTGGSARTPRFPGAQQRACAVCMHACKLNVTDGKVARGREPTGAFDGPACSCPGPFEPPLCCTLASAPAWYGRPGVAQPGCIMIVATPGPVCASKPNRLIIRHETPNSKKGVGVRVWMIEREMRDEKCQEIGAGWLGGR